MGKLKKLFVSGFKYPCTMSRSLDAEPDDGSHVGGNREEKSTQPHGMQSIF
jgi:hypothetical protein